MTCIGGRVGLRQTSAARDRRNARESPFFVARGRKPERQEPAERGLARPCELDGLCMRAPVAHIHEVLFVMVQCASHVIRGDLKVSGYQVTHSSGSRSL